MVLTAVGNDWGLIPANNSNNLTTQADVTLINNAIQQFGTTSTNFQANLICQHVDGVGADVIPSQDGFLLHVPFPCWATIMAKVMRDGDFPSLLCMSDTVKLAMAVRVLSKRRITDIIATKRRIIILNIPTLPTPDFKVFRNNWDSLSKSYSKMRMYPAHGTVLDTCYRVYWSRNVSCVLMDLIMTCLAYSPAASGN